MIPRSTLYIPLFLLTSLQCWMHPLTIIQRLVYGFVVVIDDKFAILAGINGGICNSSLHVEAENLRTALEVCRDKSIKIGSILVDCQNLIEIIENNQRILTWWIKPMIQCINFLHNQMPEVKDGAYSQRS